MFVKQKKVFNFANKTKKDYLGLCYRIINFK